MCPVAHSLPLAVVVAFSVDGSIALLVIGLVFCGLVVLAKRAH